jgi:hypothetical protein
MSPKNKTTLDLPLGIDALPNDLAISTRTEQATTEGTPGTQAQKASRTRNRSGSTKTRLRGVRTVKEYPLDQDELWELGGLGLVTTMFFSAASACFGVWINIQMSLDLAEGADPFKVGLWQANMTWSKWGAIVFTVLGTVSLLGGGIKVWRIIANTKHEDSNVSR